MPINNSEYRNSLFQLLISPEDADGIPIRTDFPNWDFIGMHSNIALPDPVYNFSPIYGFAKGIREGNSRSWAMIHRGKQEFSGSFGETKLWDSRILAYALGQEIFTDGTHDIREANSLPSFALDARFYNVDSSNIDFIRRWKGCKIDGLTLSCNQQGFLSVAIEKFYALNMVHNAENVGYDSDQKGYNKYDPSLIRTDPKDYPFSGETDPYLFSECEIKVLDESVIKDSQNTRWLARVVSFNLTIDNNLTPKYYEVNSTTNIDEFQAPYEILEGKREYKLQMELDVPDQNLYEFLVTQGYYGIEKRGYGFSIKFTKRPNIITPENSLEIRIPGATDTHDWSTIDASTPVASEQGANMNMGAFLIRAPHGYSENQERLRVMVEAIVPSVSFYVQDKQLAYL